MQRRATLRLLWGILCTSALPCHSQAQLTDDLPDTVDVLCSYPAGGLGHRLAWSTLAKASVPQIVQDITQVSGLRPNFYVGTGDVPNATAGLEHGPQGYIRVIVYNPTWMAEITRYTRTDWAGYSIIAHELGHHLQGHTILTGGSQPAIELEADEFSGFIVARLGGSVDQAQVAIRTVSSSAGSATHPPRHLRLAAIADGWDRGRASGPAGGRLAPPRTVADASAAPATVASPGAGPTTCVTPIDSCALPTPSARGTACRCTTPIGAIPGVTR